MAAPSLKNDPARSAEEIKQAVRETYAHALSEPGSRGASSSREAAARPELVELAQYSTEELATLPADAVENSFGCGNPLSFAGVRPGDAVLDIGSGAGIDALLAAKVVGPTGKVIGIDFGPEMVARAQANATRAGVDNVEFRLGDAESMPLADASVDWVISNCVISLAPDKRKVFAEVFRVLKPGGRVSISDMVTGELPDEIRNDMAFWSSCVGGAIEEREYLRTIQEAGLEDIHVVSRQRYDEEAVRSFIRDNAPARLDRGQIEVLLERHRDVIQRVWSARIVARKPA